MKTEFLLLILSNKKSLLIIFLFIFSFNTKAQDCSTPDIPIEEMLQLPWFGNPNYLPAFMDSINRIHNISNSRVENNIIWRIPIRFWILTERTTSPPNLLNDSEDQFLPQERDLQRLVDDVNFAFRTADAPTNIRFYMEPARLLNVNNSDMSDTNLFLHLSANPAFRDSDAINVYIRSADDGGQYTTSLLDGYIVIPRVTYTDSGLATSLTHEIGHYLGLAHTHQYVDIPCFREPVMRGNAIDPTCLLIGNYNPFVARCSYTGDALCDTEADPNMRWSRSQYSNANCSHNGTVKDYRGDTYRPLVHNYMAYGNNGRSTNSLASTICRSQFTRDQVGVMQYRLQNTLRGRFGIWKVDAAGRGFDMYEPNNTINGAENVRGIVDNGVTISGRRGLTNALQLNLPQTHSFHNSLDGQVRDNEDWIPIERPVNGIIDNYTITVQSTIANLIEDIEVFTSTTTNGISVSVPLPTRIFSATPSNQTTWQISIPCGVVNAPTRLFFRVRRNQNLNQFGTYTVLATSSAPSFGTNFPKAICQNQINTVSLSSVPANSSVVWSYSIRLDGQANLSFSSLPSTGSSINFSTPLTSGSYILRAVVTNSTTGCNVTIQREIKIGTIPVANLQISTERRPPNVCPSMVFSLQANLIRSNGIEYDQIEEFEWSSSNSGYTFITSPNQESVMVQAPATANRWTRIKLRVRNACGWTERTVDYQTSSSICAQRVIQTEVKVYPNPTKSDIKVIFNVDCPDCKKSEMEALYPQIDASTLVTVSDAFGNVRLSYIGKQIPLDINKNIHLNLAKLPFGNYVLKIITKEKVFFAHVIKE